MVEFIPIQIDKSHLSTIGERLYSQSLDLIRELVANAYDADATIVKIKVDDSSIIVEDNGSGMDRAGLEQYLTIGSDLKRKNPLSRKFRRVLIGEFGIGKFAVLSVCDRFEILTRSEKYSATLIFDRNDFETRNDWNIPLVEHKLEINSDTKETGTRVSLFDVKKPISLFDLERHLIHIFPLTDRNFSIYLNNNKLSFKYIPGTRFKMREQTRFGEISGEIILASLMLQKESVGVGIRVRGILIKRETFNIESLHALSVRRLTGEVNANFLPITAARNDFIKDTDEYREFEKIMTKRLRKVVKSLQLSAASYQDKKAEQILSDVLLNIRDALKKSRDILLLETLPLFAKNKSKFQENESLSSHIVSTALSAPAKINRDKDNNKDILSEVLKKIKPKARSRIKTLLRDKNRIIKKVKIGGSEFLVSFAHLGNEEKESFTEGGIIFVNRDHELFKNLEGKSDLIFYHLIRLISQEIIKLAEPANLEIAFDWQGKLMKNAYAAKT